MKTWTFARLTTSANHHAASSPMAEKAKEVRRAVEEGRIAMAEASKRRKKKQVK